MKQEESYIFTPGKLRSRLSTVKDDLVNLTIQAADVIFALFAVFALTVIVAFFLVLANIRWFPDATFLGDYRYLIGLCVAVPTVMLARHRVV